MNVQDIADSLWASLKRGEHMPSEWKGRLDMDLAYRVQLALLDRYVAAGARQAGWKVGLTAAAMRIQQGVNEPCFGFLLEEGHRDSGVVLRRDTLIDPGFENELCLTVGSELRGPGVTLEQVVRAVSHAAPALEIVERRGNFAADLPLSIADNAQQKAFVTGKPVPLGPDNNDLAAARVQVIVNGAETETASGAAVMEHGAFHSVVWLANRLADFGRSIQPGMRIMSGSFTRQYGAGAGEKVEARFQPFGTVRADFA